MTLLATQATTVLAINSIHSTTLQPSGPLNLDLKNKMHDGQRPVRPIQILFLQPYTVQGLGLLMTLRSGQIKIRGLQQAFQSIHIQLKTDT